MQLNENRCMFKFKGTGDDSNEHLFIGVSCLPLILWLRRRFSIKLIISILCCTAKEGNYKNL